MPALSGVRAARLLESEVHSAVYTRWPGHDARQLGNWWDQLGDWWDQLANWWDQLAPFT